MRTLKEDFVYTPLWKVDRIWIRRSGAILALICMIIIMPIIASIVGYIWTIGTFFTKVWKGQEP